MNRQNKVIISFLLLALISTSCGESGSGPTQVTSGGIGGTGISQGTVTEFGSVWVNGVEFDTSNTTFKVDDSTTNKTQDDLKKGMVVTVKGTVNSDGVTGTATSIEYEDRVEGPVESINGNTLVVLGQTVIVDDNTKYEDTSGTVPQNGLAKVQIGDRVEISGLSSTGGVIQATLVDDKGVFNSSDDVELTGRIGNLDTVNTTFTIGTQSIRYDGPDLVFEDGMTEDDLQDNLLVEVKGNLSAAILVASRIEKEDNSISASEDDYLEIEGLVTSVTNATSFSVNDQPVVTNTSTEFKRGASDDIALGTRLEVEGTVNAAGVLVAHEVEFHGNRIKIHATVDTSDQDSVTLLGKVIQVNALTEYEDKRDNNPSFNLSSIQANDWLEIRGYLSGTTIIATKIERDKERPKVILQAPVDPGSVADPNLSLLGITVDTASVSGPNFKDDDDQSIGRAIFFNQVQDGSLVKAKGSFSGGTLTAEEIEIED